MGTRGLAPPLRKFPEHGVGTNSTNSPEEFKRLNPTGHHLTNSLDQSMFTNILVISIIRVYQHPWVYKLSLFINIPRFINYPCLSMFINYYCLLIIPVYQLSLVFSFTLIINYFPVFSLIIMFQNFCVFSEAL